MEERRLILAVALSLLVLTAYQLLFPPAPPPARPASVASPAAEPAPSGSPAAALGSLPAPPTVGAPPVPAPSPAAAAARVADDKERRVELEAPEVALAFTNKGARLLSWQLPEFKDSRGRPEEMVRMVAGAPRPLDIETGDPTLDGRLQAALFRP